MRRERMRRGKMKRMVGLRVAKENIHQVNVLPKVFVVVAVLLLLIGAAMWMRFASVGQAVKTPPIIDLDVTASDGVDTSVFSSATFTMRLSKENTVHKYDVEFSDTDKGFTQYVVRDITQLAKGVEVTTVLPVAQGLLNSQLSEQKIFLNDDVIADLLLELEGSEMMLTNLNYVSPGAAVVSMLDKTKKEVAGNLLDVKSAEDLVYYFKVTSKNGKMPQNVSAKWKDGAVLSNTEFVKESDEVKSGEMVMKFSGKMQKEMPRILVLTVTVDDVVTSFNYYFAVDGVFFVQKAMDGLPNVLISKDETGKGYIAEVNVTGKSLQGFALPCGSAGIGQLKKSNEIVAVYGYDVGKSRVQQWRANVPSDLDVVSAGGGYAVRLKDSVSVLQIWSSCLDISAKLVVLQKGWNLIGVQGYEIKTVEQLKKEEVPLSIQGVYMVGSEVLLADSAELLPGRAYWVYVG